MRNADPSAAWFRQPVVWLCVVILAASIVGCLAMIALAWRYPDVPVPTHGAKAMKVPVDRSAATSPAPAPETAR